MLIDMKSNTSVIASLDSVSRAHNGGTDSDGVFAGTATRLHDFSSVTVLLNVGTVGSSATVTFKLEESINGTDWTNIAASRLIVDPANVSSDALKAISVANTTWIIGLTDVGNTTDQYIRVHATSGVAASVYSAFFIRQNPRHAPANATGTPKSGGILIG
jgi:hypothetical protein